MNQYVTSKFKLGFIAGGQLGKMLALAASPWDVETWVMDPDENCPSRKTCQHYVKGSYLNYEDVKSFAEKVDMLIMEIEHVNIQALHEVAASGKKVFPSPQILEIIQDKGLQKTYLAENDFPTSAFKLYETVGDLKSAIADGTESLPFVQKARTLGYDGQGVKVVKEEADIEALLDAPSVVERFVPFEKELAVIVARNASGDVKCFPLVEMVFKEGANLVDQLQCPAHVDSSVIDNANKLATDIAENMQLEGILAIELFMLPDGSLLVNEMAPRPHNSGHHTIEGCITSQYEQLLRAGFNWPLGSTALHGPSIMVNILGEEGHKGLPKYEGLEECMALEGVSVHIYGKTETRPNRKMGHVTIVNRDLNKALEAAKTVKETLKVTSWTNQ